jgi:hypothetical protein
VFSRSPRNLVIAVVIGASALVGCGGGSGGSSDVIVPVDGRPANPAWSQLDPAMKDTLSAVAEQYGISREDARERIGWQNAFSMAVDGIQPKYPNAFSRGEITNELPARTVIVFKGPVPPDVASMLVTVPREVEIRLSGGREFTSEEIAQRVINAMHAANDTGLIHATSAEFDDDSGTVQIVGRPKNPDADKVKDAQHIEQTLSTMGLASTVSLTERAIAGSDAGN